MGFVPQPILPGLVIAMLTDEQAMNLAKIRIDEIAKSCGEELQLLHEQTIVRPKVSAFFYQSTEFVRTGNPATRLAGNGPILVHRISGEVVVAGTAYPSEHYILELENR